MSKFVRLFFNRKKKATETAVDAIEIVVTLQRQRCYFYTGFSININQWDDNSKKVVNHSEASLLNHQIAEKLTEYEHILIAMKVNKDDMTIAQFKTYIGTEGNNRRNFMAWIRERIEKRKLGEGTRKGHLTMYHSLERFGKFKTFDDITLQHINQFDLFIREEETFTTKGKPITRSDSAIHNYHKRFKPYVTEAFNIGLIKENPAALVSLLRENNRRERYFTPDEIRRLFRAADQHESFYTGQYVKMLLLTGLRRAELARAKWQHYNKEDKTLYIPHTKNGHSRVLHLNHMAVELLNYLPVTQGNPYLFPGKRQGQPLQNPTKGFQRMLARAGIDKEGVCLHTCRHSVAALIVSNGGTLFDVQSQLGHRSSQTSLRYAHLHNTRMQQTSQKIANCIHDALTSSVPSKPLPQPEEGEWVQAS